MTKIVTITCDICEADVTNRCRMEVTYLDPDIAAICRTLHFCCYEHMFEFLDKRRPQD